MKEGRPEDGLVGRALPRATNLAFMLVRYRFSMALCAAFLRFMTAFRSESVVAVGDLDVVVVDDDDAMENLRAGAGLRRSRLIGLADDTRRRSLEGSRVVFVCS